MRHPFSSVRSTSFRQLSPSIVTAFPIFALLIALQLAALWISPAAAQEATPFPRIGDLPRAAGCNELLVNGGFEVDDLEVDDLGWLPLTPALPPDVGTAYVTSPVFTGMQALRIGNVDGANTAIISGVYQVVNLPSQANPIVLRFQYFSKHEPNPGNDLQFLDIVDETTSDRTPLWRKLANQDTWLFEPIDLTHLQGRRVRIEFGVSNDGSGGRTALYLDQISLQSCPSTPDPTPTGGTPTPSPTLMGLTPTPSPTFVTGTPTVPLTTATPTLASPFPTATPTPLVLPPSPTLTATPILSPTPLPPGCISNIILNGSFEEAIGDHAGHSGWIPGNDPVPPRLNGETAYEGLRSMRLGNPPGPGSRNVKSYSSVRQLITVPQTATTAKLLWAHQSFAQAPANFALGAGDDRQELILLTPALVTIEILYRQLRNDGVWRLESSDLTPYLGQTFFIYFNAFNNGDGLRTWMNLDAVRLELCFSVPPTPTFTPILATSTPSPVDAVERAAPGDSERSLAQEAPAAESTLEAIEPENVQESANILVTLGNFLLRNWGWTIGLVVVAGLVWRFVLHK